MVEKSLREWAENLEKRGDLVVIDKEVSTKFEIAAYIKKSCEVEGPAFRFTNVTGYETEVIGGFYGTKARILESVGVETHEQGVAKYVDATNNLIEPELVSKAPVKEVIKTGEDVDLYEILLLQIYRIQVFADQVSTECIANQNKNLLYGHPPKDA
jgi:UbiD family decarboxylase